MNGKWWKRCPQCGNYIMKDDPRESAMCCACGWEEYRHGAYCDVVNQHCPYYSASHVLTLAKAA